MEEVPPEQSFGAYLRLLREHEGLSLGAVVLRLRALGAPSDKSTLSRYETDARDKLDPLVIWGLARVYRQPVEQLLNQLAKRSGAKSVSLPPSRLTQAIEHEQQLVRLFRRASGSLQREILEWVEYKVNRAREGSQPQPRAAASGPRQTRKPD